MALQIIGAGWGRTGTETLRDALEILGFGPCHHMHVLRDRPETFPVWRDFARAGADAAAADWDALYAGFRAAVDFPTAAYWRELAAQYPQAKVILTTRDPLEWFDSVMESVMATLAEKDRITDPHKREVLDFSEAMVGNGYFRGNPPGRADAAARMAAHEADVRATIPAERLLVWSVRQGWGPLAAFLGVPVPDAPFPASNARGVYRENWA